MKLIRFGEVGSEKPGVLLEGGIRIDVSALSSDYNEDFFSSGGLDILRSWLAQNASLAPKVPASVRLGPPVRRPSKIVCIGLNFRDHAAESKMDPPKEPVIFFKSTTSLVGPNDDVQIPRQAEKVDWEVELAVVIEKKATYVSESQALDYVAGFALQFLGHAIEGNDAGETIVFKKLLGKISQTVLRKAFVAFEKYLVKYVP